MKKLSSLLTLSLSFFALQSCTTYYLCDSNTVIPIYATAATEQVVYTVPKGEQVLVRGKSGDLRYTQFGYYYGWTNANLLRYIKPTSPKRYFESHPNASNTKQTAATNKKGL